MGFNLNNKETWWYVSEENMMLNHDVWGREGLWCQGVHDSIEQTYHAYVAYGYEPFIDGIKNCWKKIEYKNPILKKLFGYYYKPQRYPIKYDGMKGMSRDHVIYSFMAFIKSGMSKEEIYEYASHLTWKIGDNIGTIMTPKLWLWMMLISGKKIGYLYYISVMFGMLSANNKNNFIEKISGYGFAINEEEQKNFKPLFSNEKPKIIKTIANMYFPTYAVKLTANMLNVVPENWFVKKSRYYAIKMIPKHNVVLKLLLKQNLTETEISELLNYKSMTGDRWSDQLNKWYSDRPLYIIEERYPEKEYTKENTLDKDYALKLYYNTL